MKGPMWRRLNASLRGRGTRTLVFGHGFGTDQHVWAPYADRYADRFQVLTFDLDYLACAVEGKPPHEGLAAYADDLVALLHEGDVRNAVFVGHSVSGMIGALAGIAAPHAFGRLILINAAPRYIEDFDYPGAFSRADVERLYEHATRAYEDWVIGFAPAATAQPRGPAVDNFARHLNDLRPDIGVAVLRSILESDLRAILPAITTPTTLLNNRDDIVVPASVSTYMLDHIPNATCRWLDASGHLPHVTAVKDFTQILDALLIGEAA